MAEVEFLEKADEDLKSMLLKFEGGGEDIEIPVIIRFVEEKAEPAFLEIKKLEEQGLVKIRYRFEIVPACSAIAKLSIVKELLKKDYVEKIETPKQLELLTRETETLEKGTPETNNVD